jgi:hypothetical protein
VAMIRMIVASVVVTAAAGARCFLPGRFSFSGVAVALAHDVSGA